MPKNDLIYRPHQRQGRSTKKHTSVTLSGVEGIKTGSVEAQEDTPCHPEPFDIACAERSRGAQDRLRRRVEAQTLENSSKFPPFHAFKLNISYLSLIRALSQTFSNFLIIETNVQ